MLGKSISSFLPSCLPHFLPAREQLEAFCSPSSDDKVPNNQQGARPVAGHISSNSPNTFFARWRAPIAAEFEPSCSNMELKDNTVIVVLGASGDLAKKKTVGLARLLAYWQSTDGCDSVPSFVWSRT